MASYQDLQSRVQTLEEALKFVMMFFSVGDASKPFTKPKTLLQFYHEMKTGLLLPPDLCNGMFRPTNVAEDPATDTPTPTEDAHGHLDPSGGRPQDAPNDVLL